MWVALLAVLAASAGGVGFLAWRLAAVRGDLRVALAQVQTLRDELAVLTTQTTRLAESWAEERGRLNLSHLELMKAVGHAHDEIRAVLSAPGVPAHLAGEYSLQVLNAHPDPPDPGGGGRVPPITRPPARTPPGGRGRR